MSDLPQKFTDARFKLGFIRPYLGRILYALKPVLTTTMPYGMATDQWLRLYIHPEYLERYSPDETLAVLYHETQHPLRRHGARTIAWGFEPFLANLAGDMTINPGIREETYGHKTEKFTLPAGVVYPEIPPWGYPVGLSMEDYYERLLKQAQAEGGEGHGPGHGDCGSAADGHHRPWEQPDMGEDGTSQAEQDLIVRKVAEDTLERQRQRGNVPAYLVRWAGDLLTPTQNWKTIVAAAIRHSQQVISGKTDYTFARRSRRQDPRIIWPGMISPVPNVAGLLDTSGSMSQEEIRQGLSEFKGVLDSVHLGGIHFLAADAAVHLSKRIFSAAQMVAVGGGGTDMRVGIEAATKLRPRLDLLIVFTDGETPWPEAPPPMRVIVVKVGTGGSVPAWAKAIQIPG